MEKFRSLEPDKEPGVVVYIPGGWCLEPEQNVTRLAMDPSLEVFVSSNHTAAHYVSLEHIRSLDILYLSDDVMVMRANDNVESLFVWQRIL